MKARYLDEQHRGHGVTFATGTPISNTMVEMYTMQRFLDPVGLRSRGIEHFDAWAATFGEVAPKPTV
jgi:N12 class adenine-specific DNA methylase